MLVSEVSLVGDIVGDRDFSPESESKKPPTAEEIAPGRSGVRKTAPELTELGRSGVG